ncbi:MAG: hypothetical protein ACK5GO_02715 [Ignavibacteria bacterium]|jgi:hypothetical protein
MQLLKDIGIVLLGLLLGGTLNMVLVEAGMLVFPAPEGIDISTEAGLKSAMTIMSPIHFIFPFLAHALGTLFGAWFAIRFTKTKHISAAYSIGMLFLLGGIMMVVSVGGPIWFIMMDLTLAYLPMAWLGYKLGKM